MCVWKVNLILLDVRIASRETTFSWHEETSDGDGDRVSSSAAGSAQILNFSH